ncbi:Uncharacterized protein M6B38_233535 [Iris pallida]|uniref:Uncharacterized protein n=1 Tax=Iris pallida TaxID=29817 RepID=A0AAX6DQG8_IRIPA|nr:Uncharacterized protein M6B38_233535 [Iris pallida]
MFFKREFSRNWPSLVGFGITGALITKFFTGQGFFFFCKFIIFLFIITDLIFNSLINFIFL